MVTSSGSNNRYGQGLVSFRELDGGQRSPPMGLFSKILERVRNTMASEPSSSQVPPLVTSPLSVNSETESSSNYHPFQSIHAATSNSSQSKNVQNISAPFISSSAGISPPFSSSSSVVGLDVAKAAPSISYKENKGVKTSEKSPSSGFSFSSAIPSFFQVPTNKRKQPISSEPETLDEEPVETLLEPYSNHDSPKRTNSIKNTVDSQPSLILSPPENHEPPRNPFYQLGEAAQGSATSFFSSRPSDAMTMILRRLQGQGEGLNRDYWMKDEHCHSCYNCDRTFNPLLRRKHHCRICGQIFCSECTSKLIPGDSLGQPGLIKVCDYCYRLRQTYQSSGRLLDVNSNTPSPSPGLNPSTSNNILSKDRKQDDSHYAKSPSGLATSKKENVEGLKRLLTAGTRVVDAHNQEVSPFRHRVTLEEDNDSPLTPSENLDPILSNEAISDSPDSDAPYSMITGFKGSIFANQPSDAGDLLTTNLPRSQSQVWRSLMQQNATSPNARKLMRKLTVTSIDPATPSTEHTRSKSTCEVQLNIASLQHIRRLLRELLESNQIDSSWEDIITSLALKAAHRLELNVKDGDSMDIRRYVKIKRIPGGSPSDSEYINGVVCSKALTHKTMLRTLVRPRILILTFPFEYQRVEYQFSSLDPLLAQESEHLKNMVARVLALRPTLVIVEKSIARIALDFLHKANLCVAMNVKPSVIRALARCTQAEVISSLEKLRQEPKLGDCQKFEVRTYMHELIPQWRKSYFFFHGCKPSLGCTLVLRGGDIQLLGKLKRVTELITYAAYCLKLETVLLRDQLAMIPNQLNSSTLEQTMADSQNNVSEKPLNADLDEKDIDRMLQPYRIKTLSTSPFVKFPPPYLLLRMKEEAVRIRDLEEKHKLVMVSKVAGSLSSPHPEDDIPDSRLEIGLSLQKDSAAAVEEHLQNLRAHQVFIENFQPPISPFAHQNITILYCNVSTTETTICQAPQSHTIEYYQSSDLTLGQFLELSCFDLSMLCGTCDKSVLKHLRSYVHGNARVTVTVEDLPSPITGMESTILMWSYCKLCDKVLPVVPMSEETWKFSLGKYLELAFYHAPLSCRAGMCPHDIHRDHVRYFGLRDLAARFEYEPIDLMEVRVPPTRLYFKPEISQRLKHQDFETLRSKINLYWDSVNEKVKVLLNYSISTAKPEQCRQELTEMSRRVAAERNYVLQVLQQTFVNSHPTDTLALNLVLRVIHEKVLEWDAEFSSITQKYLQTESDLRRLTSHQLRRLFPDRDILGTDTTQHQQFLRDLTLEGPVKESMQTDDTHLDMFPHLSSSPSDTPGVCFFPDALDHLPTRQSYVPVMNPVTYRRHSLKLMREERSQREERAVQSNSSPSHAPITPLPTGDKSTDDYLSAGSKRFIPRVTPSFGPGGSARASIFDDLKVPKNASAGSLPRLARPNSNKSSPISRGTPRVNINTPTSTTRGSSRPPAPASTLLSTPTSRGPASLRVSKPRPGTRSVERRVSERVPRSGPTENTIRSLNERKIKRSATTATSRPSRLGRPSIAVYSNARDAVEEESDSEEDSRPRGLKIGGIHGAYPGLGDMELSSTSPDADDFGSNPALGVLGLGEEVFSAPTPSLMPEISREEDPLPSEFSSDVPPPETRDNAYDRGSIIQTLSTFLGGPSSIGLVSLEYPIQPTEHLFADSPIVIREDEPSSVIAFTLSSRDYLEQMKKIQNSPPDSPDRMVERELQAKDGTHLRYQLGEGAIRMTCKVFFAHHFDALRRHCDQDGLFIESLARCVKWSASGGKSGSIFLKTRDDRLVMKEVSKAELDAFLKFAPLYFSHMAEALFEGLPALLAKIFGLYRISIKNIHTGRSMRIDVLIIENLFYERRISRIFDLKGSLRNRLVQSTGKENEVLLDENLMEIICHSPIFIRAHSKQLLHMAIFNDTKFLSSLKVMDYSLLVGIDEERNELVVGMVDFIRTFTWDKKLESWVKENAFLGGREQPTIVSPSLYKHRFRGFMDKYFLMVPDKYYIPSIELKLPRTSN